MPESTPRDLQVRGCLTIRERHPYFNEADELEAAKVKNFEALKSKYITSY